MLVLWAAPSAAAAPSLVPVAEFTDPVAVAGQRGDERLFVAEQAGRVRVLSAAGALQAEPFLDLSGQVLCCGERGLLGLALADDHLFVYLTARQGALGAAQDGEIQIRRYTIISSQRADPATGVVLLRQPHAEFPNHNGGALRIGFDGMLWAGIGDGGGGDNPLTIDGVRTAQSRKTLLGKIVRITQDGQPAPGNPYIGATDGSRPEIWHYGLRNPYRFSFDRGTGNLIIGDVGEGQREEVDVATAAAGLRPGANWGWPCLEGTRANVPCRADGARAPSFELDHGADGAISIIGGVVVRDVGLPTLAGRYLYSDFAFEAPRSLVLDGEAAAGNRIETGLAASRVVSFDEDGCGRVVVTSLSGPVYRVVDGARGPCQTDGPPPIATPTPTVTPMPPGCQATLRGPGRMRLRRLRRSGVPVRVSALVACEVSAAGARETLVPGAERVLRITPSQRRVRALQRAVRRKGAARLVVRVRLVPAATPGQAFTRRVRLLVV